MDAQQTNDYVFKPTLNEMGGNYNSPESRLLLLGTYAIESDMGLYNRQLNGPASGPGQMEPPTLKSIFAECDALRDPEFLFIIREFAADGITINLPNELFYLYLETSPKFACAMARLKYAMDDQPLPKITGNRKVDEHNFYDYYKRVYNTGAGKSTFSKWQIACEKHKVFEVKL